MGKSQKPKPKPVELPLLTYQDLKPPRWMVTDKQQERMKNGDKSN